MTLKEAVIVEGRYDKIKLRGIIDSPIIETNGFRVFHDSEKLSLIRRIAARSDTATFLSSRARRSGRLRRARRAFLALRE